MTITNVRDPRDLLPDILRPEDNIPALEETAYVQRELGDDGLRVWFNIPRQKFVVQDVKAPGGPAASYVMIVQNPDGSGRDFDNRTVETLRRIRFRHTEMADELAKRELARERRVKSDRESFAHAVATDLKWIGNAVAPSVGWRERSLAREAIRKAAS